MARGSRSSAQTQRRPTDLTSIISVAERNDLVALASEISEKMLKDITDVFDSPSLPLQELTNVDDHFHCMSLALHNHRRRQQQDYNKSKQSIEKGWQPRHPNYSCDAVGVVKAQSATPQLAELQKEAVTFFRKWQTTILQKLRDITVSPPSANLASASETQRGRPSRGSLRGRGGRGGAQGPPAPRTVDQETLSLATGPLRIPSPPVDSTLARHYPPTANPLWTTSLQKRKLYHHIVLLSLLSSNEYSANAHIFLSNLASSLNLPSELCRIDEVRLARGLAQTAMDVAPEVAAVQKEENKNNKRWKFSLGVASNSVPRLASTLTAVGVGTLQGGYGLPATAAAGLLGSMSDNGLAIGALFGFNPSKPLDKTIEGFGREVQDFALNIRTLLGTVEYTDSRQVPANQRRLRLIIAISGFLLEEDDVDTPWMNFDDNIELYTVKWEVAALQSLGSSLATVIKSRAWKIAKEAIAAETVFNSLIHSRWPVGLLKISKIVDNPWSVGMVRAEKAGSVLADAIIRHKVQGDRPVSLVGYSLAARAIYACLMILAERRQFGAIESVVLMGTPAPSESKVWLTLKSVVAGRLVNVYSEQDYILGFLYRTSNIHYGVAGLQDVQGANGVENYRVPRLDHGHLSYLRMAPKILRDLNWDDLKPPATRRGR